MRESVCLLRAFRRCSFRCLLPHLSLRDIFPRWGKNFTSLTLLLVFSDCWGEELYGSIPNSELRIPNCSGSSESAGLFASMHWQVRAPAVWEKRAVVSRS